MGKEKTMMVLNPFIETVSNPVEFARFYDHEGALQQVRTRAEQAIRVEYYFKHFNELPYDGPDAYDAYAALMEIVEAECFNERLALYVPINFLSCGWEEINEIFLRAWLLLLAERDVRESFNLGDVYERKASKGSPERVIKCLHLLPWLIDDGHITMQQLFALMKAHECDPLFLSCVYDCIEVFEDWGCMERIYLAELKQRYELFDYKRPKQTLTYTTAERSSWQAEYTRGVNELPVTLHNVTGPFSANRASIQEAIDWAAKNIKEGQVACIGGSRAKGYSTGDSDYDIFYFKLEELENVNPDLAHIVFNTFWVSNDPKIEEKRASIAARYMALPEDSPFRRDCLNRLEADLLQYRLMHKGFPYAYGKDLSKALQKFTSIDGGSAFYDVRYRRVAATLYAKYVFIPQF